MEQLYALITTEDPAKQDLYIKQAGNVLDFCTYFNSFSLKKWRQYTTLQTVTIKLSLDGPFEVTLLTVDRGGEHILQREQARGAYEHTLKLSDTDGDLLGFRLKPLSVGARYLSGAYHGTASEWHDKKIGVGICTFKREEYVRRTMAVLSDFQKEHRWLSVLVVDNGSTLPVQEIPSLRVVHNRNYGGSGGFTRAMIEYVEEGRVDYILLMDDDIILEPSAIERTHSLLSCLKSEYRDSFLSGAMLSLEQPTIQYENTAYWGKIRLHGLGKGFHMDDLHDCVRNELLGSYPNQYGAWWYCCIPLHRIREIGYPLPVFLKGDDMEYGIRNHRPIMSMNGIAVWHQAFSTKISDVVNYYSDRNMLIINNYAAGCSWATFLLAVCGRFVKRLLQGRLMSLQILCKALADYNSGLQGITACRADDKMKEVQACAEASVSFSVVVQAACAVICSILTYPKMHQQYAHFRKSELSDASFWKQYLHMEGAIDERIHKRTI